MLPATNERHFRAAWGMTAMNHKKLIALFLAGLAVSVTGAAATGEHVLRLRMPGQSETLDPHLRHVVADRVLDTMMLDGLTREDATGAPVPAAAVSWEISPDGRRYTFHLRQGARFSDNHPVTSGDFLYALRRLVDPKTAAGGTDAILPVLHARDCLAGKMAPEALGVSAPDPMTLVIELEHADVFFSTWAAQLVPLEKEVLDRWGREWVQPGHMVSNGPFVLAEYIPHGNIKFVRNPTYWNAAKIRLEEVDFLAVDNARTAQRMFQAGEMDIVSLSSEDVRDGKLAPNAQVHTAPLNRTSYLFFNMRQGPLAESQPLRRALALTLDQPLIIKIQQTLDDPAFAMIPPQFPNYPHPREDFADRSMQDRLAQARTLYAQAGYNANHPLEFKFTYWDGKTCAALQEMWRAALGAKVNCEIFPDDNGLFAAYRTGQFELGGKSESSAAPDARNLLDNIRHAPPNPTENEGDYSNPRFNDLLDQANGIADPTVHGAKVAEAEQVLLADQAIIPLSFTRVAYATSPNVTGYQQLPSRSLFVDSVDIAP